VSGISNIGSSGEQHELAEYVDGLPNLCGAEALIAATIKDAARPGFPAPASEDPFAEITRSATVFTRGMPAAQPAVSSRRRKAEHRVGAARRDAGAGAAWHDRGHARR
jgi:hypothetical protein